MSVEGNEFGAPVDGDLAPIIPPIAIVPKTYHQHYTIALNDIFDGNYAAMMREMRTTNNPPDGASLLSNFVLTPTTFPSNLLGMFEYVG
jgi:hypothetical protein